MANSLSERLKILQQKGYFESGGGRHVAGGLGEALENVGKGFNSVTSGIKTGLDLRDQVLNARLAQEKAVREAQKQASELTPMRDLIAPLTRENATINESTTPEQRAEMDKLYAKRDALGDENLAQSKTRAEISNLLETTPVTPPKTGVHRIISKKTGKVLYSFPSSPGTGDTITEVGEDSKDDKNVAKEDAASRRGVNVIKNYYTSLRALQGDEQIGAGKSTRLGVEGLLSRIPVVGRSMMKDMSQTTGFRVTQGARLAGAMGDSGNKALAEQKNALELLSPPGTRDLDLSEKQALATLLEGIKNKTPEEEKEYQEAVKAFEMGKEKTDSSGAVPKVGETFNGEKVISVKKIQ